MDKILSHHLRNRFHQICDNENALFSNFGFEVGSGWYFILYEALLKLESIPQELGPIRILQIKEKFGSLSFYLEGPEEALAIAQEAELESSKTCDICGNSGHLITEGWWRTRCSTHSANSTFNTKAITAEILLKANHVIPTNLQR